MALDHGPVKESAEVATPEAAVARRPAEDPVVERLMRLRAGGNRALARRMASRRTLQRVGGWSGTGVATANQAEGTYSGVRRIPVEGLTTVARALVLVPPGFDPAKPTDVIVHLHGQNTGYRDAAPRDLDAKLDRVEEQMAAAGRAQMVAVLPQGSTTGADYGEFANLKPRAYAKQALDKVVALGGLTVSPTIGSVVLSGHSGGGFAMKTILDDAVRQKDLSGVVWFDAIQPMMTVNDKRVTTGQRETAKTLIHDRITAELAAVPTAASDPDKEKALASGFQFRLYYNASGFYAGAAGEIETFLKGLFGEAGSPPAGQTTLAAQIAALPTAARAALRLRYQTIPVAQSATPNRTGGNIETLGHDNMVGSGALQDALTKMPFGRASASTAAPPTMPAPTPPPKSSSLDENRFDDENVLAMATGPEELVLARSEDVASRLVDETVALGHADGDPPGGRTLLRRDDIRASLAARAGNATLNGPFEASVRALSAIPEGSQRNAEYGRHASGLILMLEDAFIADPTRSAIDLLPPARAAHFRGMTWHRLDYPGHAPDEAAGPHEGEATAMAAELAVLRPERRPNSGANAVIIQSEMTAAKRGRISAHLSDVRDQPHARLFDEAARAFERMASMAAYDGVDLTILDSYRPPAVAAANAAASGNAMAVAAFSSHSLGLAVDLQMSHGTQQFQEMTTRPMSNVAGMRAAPAHKWMVLRAEEFGWFPYGNEPWHWEYNPPGFRDRFRAVVDPQPVPAAAAP